MLSKIHVKVCKAYLTGQMTVVAPSCKSRETWWLVQSGTATPISPTPPPPPDKAARHSTIQISTLATQSKGGSVVPDPTAPPFTLGDASLPQIQVPSSLLGQCWSESSLLLGLKGPNQ